MNLDQHIKDSFQKAREVSSPMEMHEITQLVNHGSIMSLKIIKFIVMSGILTTTAFIAIFSGITHNSVAESKATYMNSIEINHVPVDFDADSFTIQMTENSLNFINDLNTPDHKDDMKKTDVKSMDKPILNPEIFGQNQIEIPVIYRPTLPLIDHELMMEADSLPPSNNCTTTIIACSELGEGFISCNGITDSILNLSSTKKFLIKKEFRDIDIDNIMNQVGTASKGKGINSKIKPKFDWSGIKKIKMELEHKNGDQESQLSINTHLCRDDAFLFGWTETEEGEFLEFFWRRE